MVGKVRAGLALGLVVIALVALLLVFDLGGFRSHTGFRVVPADTVDAQSPQTAPPDHVRDLGELESPEKIDGDLTDEDWRKLAEPAQAFRNFIRQVEFDESRLLGEKQLPDFAQRLYELQQPSERTRRAIEKEADRLIASHELSVAARKAFDEFAKKEAAEGLLKPGESKLLFFTIPTADNKLIKVQIIEGAPSVAPFESKLSSSADAIRFFDEPNTSNTYLSVPYTSDTWRYASFLQIKEFR